MRGHMDPGEYKHVALGLIFLKYISDAFEERRYRRNRRARLHTHAGSLCRCRGGRDDDEPFEEKMKRLVFKLDEQFAESARLEQAIRENLRRLGYGH